MTDTTHCRIIEIGVDIEAADGAQVGPASDLHESLPGFVEPVDPFAPIDNKTLDQPMPFDLVLLEKGADVHRDVGDRPGFWHHWMIV